MGGGERTTGYGSPELEATTPSPQLSPMPLLRSGTPHQSPLQSRSRTSSVFKSPTDPSPGKRSRRRLNHDGEAPDNISEMGQSEASEATTQQDQTMVGQPWGVASKRANQLMLLAQSKRQSALTPEALFGLSQGPPSSNLRSNQRHGGSFAVLPSSSTTAPHEQHRHQTSIWDFAGNVSKGIHGSNRPDVGTSEKYVRCALDNGDGADLLRLSCALGHLERLPSHHGSDAVSSIEDAEFHCLSQFRNVAADLMAQAIEKSSDLEGYCKILVIDALGLFAQGATRLTEDEAGGTSFLWQIAGQGRCKLNSHAMTTFALCMSHFLREATAKNPDAKLPLCRAFVSRARAWIGLKQSGSSTWSHYDLRGGSRAPKVIRLDDRDVYGGVGIYGSIVHGGGPEGEAPMRFLGVLLDAFWQKICEVGMPDVASRWLNVILEEDAKKDLGLRLSIPFIRACANRVHQGIISGKPIPKLKALSSSYKSAARDSSGELELQEAYVELERACTQAGPVGGARIGLHRGGGGGALGSEYSSVDPSVGSSTRASLRSGGGGDSGHDFAAPLPRQPGVASPPPSSPEKKRPPNSPEKRRGNQN